MKELGMIIWNLPADEFVLIVLLAIIIMSAYRYLTFKARSMYVKSEMKAAKKSIRSNILGRR